MGLWGLFRSRAKSKKAPSDQLLAIAPASVTLRVAHQLAPTGRAGVCFRPQPSLFYDALEREVRGLFSFGVKASGTEFRFVDDKYGFRWVILKNTSFDALVNGAQAIVQHFAQGGQGGQVRVVVFPFKGADQDVLWVYNSRRERFYPFVPLAEEKRDNSLEISLASKMEKGLPVEQHLEFWYGLWGVPFDAL